jgi:peptidoglycan/LPS O-acetylase OafA/YrhL
LSAVIAAEKNRVFGLDILRAAAIMLVLVGHTWPTKLWSQWAGALAVLGVELFFVLSGFLIGGILIRLAEKRRLHSWRDVVAFWRRRWFRTLPNYYLFLALHLLWRGWVLGFPDQAATNWEYFVFVQNVTHQPGFFFPETWSLAVEEWFYLLFPLLLFAGLKFFRNRWWTWAGVIALFLLIPTLLRLQIALDGAPATDAASAEGLRRVWDSIVRKAVIYRLDVVMYGVMAAAVAFWRPETWRRMAALWPCGLALVLTTTASLVWHTPLDTSVRWQAFVLWPITSIGFAFLLPACSQIANRWGRCGRVVSWVAMVSYAVYLCHGLVLLTLGRWFGTKSAMPLPKHSLLWCAAAWIITFAVAGIVYRWFERPIMDLRDRFEHPRVDGAAQDERRAVYESR